MKFHPACLMLMVWSVCVVLFYVLPFQLENRVMSLYGLLVLLVFIAVYCFGAAAATPIAASRS